jgi:DNA anti-recombination protein RmuC
MDNQWLENTLKELKEDVKDIKGDVSLIKTDMAVVKTKMDVSNEKHDGAIDRMDKHENRIADLEKFKWKLLGSMSIGSAVVSVVVTIILKLIGL